VTRPAELTSLIVADPSLNELLPVPVMKTTGRPRQNGERKGPFKPRLITPAMAAEWEKERQEREAKKKKKADGKKKAQSNPENAAAVARAQAAVAPVAAALAARVPLDIVAEAVRMNRSLRLALPADAPPPPARRSAPVMRQPPPPPRPPPRPPPPPVPAVGHVFHPNCVCLRCCIQRAAH
jgi:hypothetical protein